MSSPLPTLNEMLDPEKKQTPRQNNEQKKEEKKDEPLKEVQVEEKKVESKKEEEKKVEPPPLEEVKEEPKQEEKKDEQPKVEEEPKKKKEVPKQPREPEPKIPSDFTGLIKELTDLKNAGNELFKNKSYEEAISKYKEAYEKLEQELPKIHHEHSYNPQSEDLITLSKQIMSNLSLSYAKTEKYQESINLDLKIIASDPKYDKSYVRLFNNYLKLNQRDHAVYFGKIFLKFDEETIAKYKDLKQIIEEEEKSLQAEYDAIRAKERKEMLKKIGKYAIPFIVLIAAVAIYFFVFKKKQIAK